MKKIIRVARFVVTYPLALGYFIMSGGGYYFPEWIIAIERRFQNLEDRAK